MSDERGPDDFDVTHTPAAFGWGGIVVRDGVGSPMPDEMAIRFALPHWAEEVRDAGVVVDLCVRALQYDSLGLRVVALETLARLAARPEPLPRLTEARRQIQRFHHADDPRLRSAARAALAAVVRHER